jgi:type I restriction enzyme, S subunit
MGDLPAGWLRAPLIEISEIIMGQSPPSISYNLEGRGLAFFQGKSEFQSLYPKPVKYCDQPNKIAQAGDILLSVRAPVGPTNLCKEVSCIGRGLAAIRPIPVTSSRYLLHYFRYIEPSLSKQGTGSTFTAISKKDVEGIDVLLAPLSEQHRIVTKIEKLLTKVDACKDRLEKVPAILKRFRQSVLAAACSGRLTADWRISGKEKITPPKFETYNESSNTELPPTWNSVRSADLFSFVTSGSRGWARYYSNEGPLFVRVGNLSHETIALDLRSVQRVNPPAGAEGLRTRVLPNDILISITADVGMVALAGHDVQEAYINQHVALARPKSGFCANYVAWYLSSSEGGLKQFLEMQRGATKVGLGLDDIKNVLVPMPPLEEQHEIVQRVEALFKIADDIEKRYEKAKAHVEKLTQSILAKAFLGELVPQDPNDEPASELLKRIQEERKNQEAESRPSRKISRRRVKN